MSELRYNKGIRISLKITIGTYSFEMEGPADEVEIAMQKFYAFVLASSGSEA